MAIKRDTGFWLRIDWLTIILYLALVSLGWINIYAAVYNEEHQVIFDTTQKYGKQMIWIILSLFLIIPIFIVDNKVYPMLAYIVYSISILALIGVLIFGDASHGAKSWFEIGDYKLQPSEFTKFTTALALASFMSKQNFKITNINDIFLIATILITPALLILLQPDAGSAIIYLAFILVLYREGMTGVVLLLGVLSVILFVLVLKIDMLYIFIGLIILTFIAFYFLRKNYKELFISLGIFIGIFVILFIPNYFFIKLNLALLIGIAFSISSVYYFYYTFKKKLYNILIIFLILVGSLFYTYSVDYIYDNILQSHHQTRINVLLGIEDDPQGIGYNVNQSKIAIGSGKIYGKGFLNGTQTKYNFVPEQDTDFIFCTVGEEWGFVGTTFVIALFITLLLRIIYLAERQRSRFSKIYGYAVVSILFFHFAVNIGMVIGLLPVIGIPLPFFSYGGSSLWSFTILLFIMIKLDTSRDEVI